MLGGGGGCMSLWPVAVLTRSNERVSYDTSRKYQQVMGLPKYLLVS